MRFGKTEIESTLKVNSESLKPDVINQNTMLNAFRIAINGSLIMFNMVDSIVDEYEDESGVDTVASTNEGYNASEDIYRPTGSGGLQSEEYTSDTDTKLLLHCNGSDTSTTFTDDGNTGHTPSAQGNAQLDTADKKFGTASGLFDGSGDYITIPDHADWDFGSGDFTIDFWTKLNTVVQGACWLGRGASEVDRWTFLMFSDGRVSFAKDGGAAILTAPSGSVTADVWTHIALVRNGDNWKIYVNGISKASVSDSYSIPDRAAPLLIGQQYSGGSTLLDGWIDELRVSKGVARWTSDFDAQERDNMTLISEASAADAQPDNARIILFEEDLDSITLNTDLKAYVSRDGGTTYTQATLSDEGDYETGKQILSASVDISGQPSGTSMEYKVETLNNKDLKLHGTALSWD